MIALNPAFLLLSHFFWSTVPAIDASSEFFNVLPLPSQFTILGDPVVVQHPFTFKTNSTSEYVRDAANRYFSEIIFTRKARGTTQPSDPNSLTILVGNSNQNNLKHGVDESYTLTTGKTNILKAPTVWGAMHGLETFSQLVWFNFDLSVYQINSTQISDRPRFPFRGLMIDLARHYIPMRTMRLIIDSMTYAKFNVMHWHMTDGDLGYSIPFESQKYPKVWTSMYSYRERYTTDDVQDIVAYAHARGIRIIPEFDMPCHQDAFCNGYPELCPSPPNCTRPFDLTNNFTYEFVDGLIGEYSEYVGHEFFHLGGDEFQPKCWTTVPHIKKFLGDRNWTTSDGYRYFTQRIDEVAERRGLTAIHWDEVFGITDQGKGVSKNDIVHVWHPGMMADVLNSGFRAINSNGWYLDATAVTWEEMYTLEPLAGVTNVTAQSLLLGGEACMWAAFFDPSNELDFIWPRAAAVAERLWSSSNVVDVQEMRGRLANFRCNLLDRGINAAPIYLPTAGGLPRFIGSCYIDYLIPPPSSDGYAVRNASRVWN